MYTVVITSHFKKQLKPLVKKLRHLTQDVEKTLINFNESQNIALGNYTYKLRLKSRDLPRGKSKSFRQIVVVVIKHNILSPIAIYFKGEREDIAKKEIIYHFTKVIQELNLEGRENGQEN